MKIVIQFIIVAVVVFLADLLWLGVLMKGVYHQELGSLMRRDENGFAPRFIPAFLVYVLIPLGIVLFVWPRIDPNGSYLKAFGWGALFGLVTYGIYEFTNYAILDKWSLKIVIVDLLWGMSLCGLSTLCLKVMSS